jgi:hypothetical protein
VSQVQRLPVLQPLDLVDGPAGVEAPEHGRLVEVHLKNKSRFPERVSEFQVSEKQISERHIATDDLSTIHVAEITFCRTYKLTRRQSFEK